MVTGWGAAAASLTHSASSAPRQPPQPWGDVPFPFHTPVLAGPPFSSSFSPTTWHPPLAGTALGLELGRGAQSLEGKEKAWIQELKGGKSLAPGPPLEEAHPQLSRLIRVPMGCARSPQTVWLKTIQVYHPTCLEGSEVQNSSY